VTTSVLTPLWHRGDSAEEDLAYDGGCQHWHNLHGTDLRIRRFEIWRCANCYCALLFQCAWHVDVFPGAIHASNTAGLGAFARSVRLILSSCAWTLHLGLFPWYSWNHALRRTRFLLVHRSWCNSVAGHHRGLRRVRVLVVEGIRQSWSRMLQGSPC